jgi:hypothetical protein
VIRDLAVMLADGGECVSDLGGVREREALFGSVASDSTAFRTVEKIATTPGLHDALRAAHAWARARFWGVRGAPERLTIDVDARVITAHSEKEKAAGNYTHGYGSIRSAPTRTKRGRRCQCCSGLGMPARTPPPIMWR